ncbi:hypothetical protein K438DRAFT_2028646 [Mycena galopus ATCC 62051]|nr:hypothetical protein K438DRAFT_2028646 [Mycena galopus ATCC 62051]
MTESQFLKLPSELILACLASLPFSDLDSCLQCGNRLLRAIICESVFLRYRREQERAGVEENPQLAPNLVLADRLWELQRRETNWLNFTPRYTHNIALDFETTGLYELTSDMYFVADTPDPNTGLCTGIKYIRTSPGSEASQWHTIDCEKSIIDFGTAVEEHDLIAMVTSTVHDLDPEMASIDVLLFKFSTGAPHPLAACPVLHIHDVEVSRGHPGLSIEFSGKTMALSLVYWNCEEGDMDGLHLYNWVSDRKTDPVSVSTTGLAFVAEDMMVLPDTFVDGLKVFQILGDGSSRFLQSFRLPSVGGLIFSFQCRGFPNPRESIGKTSQATFLSRPSDSILLLSFRIRRRAGVTDHMLVVHRGRFAATINRYKDDGEVIDWEKWGPQCTRWLDAGEFATRYITAAVGYRMVTISHDAPEHPAPIRMLNFNSADVEVQRTRGPIDGPHATVRVVEPSTQDIEPFMDPIASDLPYVEIVSKQLFDYGGVLLNDQNIIGVRHEHGMVRSLEVLHFG